MKAIAVMPLKKNSQRIIELEKPTIKENEVLVKVLQAGVCRTDLEIIEGLYGETPKNDNYLILGHESIGEVIETKTDQFNLGDLVVRTVRRDCPSCPSCSHGQNDMCQTGDYTETGIKGIHGIMTKYYSENPKWLIPIPKELKDIAVLLEPLSFVEKVINQTFTTQQRMYWNLDSALILGSGPIGLLTAMVLRTLDVETTVAARSKQGNLKSEIITETGARYLSTQEDKINQKYDFIVEATGNSLMVWEGLRYLNTNGVMALTSITGDNQTTEVNSDKFNLDLVLNNNLILGVVNANRQDYYRGVESLIKFEQKWPGLTQQLITEKVSLADYQKAFEKDSADIKKVIYFNG